MKIVIVGCGKVGISVVQSLVAEGHDVVAIDLDRSVLSSISNSCDIMCVCGNATDCEALKEAGADKAELFASLCGNDETNMLACFFAKRMGAHHTIARIRSPYYKKNDVDFFRQQLDLSMVVNPDHLMAQEILRLLKLPGAVNIETFSRHNFEMIEIKLKPDSPLDGMSLSDMRRRYDGGFLVGVVQRGEDVFIPDGSFVLKGGDRIGLTASTGEIIKLVKKLGLSKKQAKNVMIIGASRTAYYLARMLIAGGNSVKIIEINPDKCKIFSESVPGAVVINGDAASQELLLEEGLRDMDAFVSLTGIDEENILLSYFAQQTGIHKIITKVNRKEFAAMADKLGLESILSLNKSISDIFVRFARALRNSLGSKIETYYKLMDEKAEALEFIAQADFKWIRTPIKFLPLRPGILICGIIRGKKTIIPTGDDEILSEDRVVVMSARSKLTDLSDIIK